jgi:hypothetical protein
MPYILAPGFTFCGGADTSRPARRDISPFPTIQKCFRALVNGTSSAGNIERLQSLRRKGRLQTSAGSERLRSCGARVVKSALLDEEPAHRYG